VRVEIEAPIGTGVARLDMIRSKIPGMIPAPYRKPAR
jgi:hypothetical protein